MRDPIEMQVRDNVMRMQAREREWEEVVDQTARSTDDAYIMVNWDDIWYDD